MSGSKRGKESYDGEDYFAGRSASSKRVRFEESRADAMTDFEIDHEDALEPRKQRRGQVTTEELSDEEEVGGGVYSSDEDGEEDDDNGDAKGKQAISEDFDMFADTPAEEATAAAKSKKGKRRLDINEIEGQDLYSRDQESDDEDEEGKKKEPPLMAFNLRQEMEEGSFDQEGNYHLNKADPQAHHDKWMEGVSRKEMAKAKEAQERRERDEALREAQRQSEVPQTKTDIYREMLNYIEPGENVREALGRLGSGSNKKIPAWKQKLMEKKNRNKKAQPAAKTGGPGKELSDEEAAERLRKVEKITGLADQMMAFGYFDIYEDTFEQMVRHIRQSGSVPHDWMPTPQSTSPSL
ncbi:hypothetical protein BX666DRAFT_1866887 [Dichotomocladium elegans]|nr:hypothetical protein BX666DRAFT_1866887 [Dichotomocladium elegans]